jgi:hypothetical protein
MGVATNEHEFSGMKPVKKNLASGRLKFDLRPFVFTRVHSWLNSFSSVLFISRVKILIGLMA